MAAPLDAADRGSDRHACLLLRAEVPDVSGQPLIETLQTVIRREFQVVRERVGGLDLWVRAAMPQHDWDLAIVRPIVEGDEYDLLPLYCERIPGIEVIVDIGAHVGGFTRRAKSLWPDAMIIAAEADPETAPVFRRNVSDIPGVHFYETAMVAPGRSAVRFVQKGRGAGDGNTGASYVLDAVRELEPDDTPVEPVCVVAAACLSDVLAAHHVSRIDVLKLDCEGSEAEILCDLRDKGYLPNTRWIRGEWHHRASIPLIEDALRPTHTFYVAENPHPWGSFIAHRNP